MCEEEPIPAEAKVSVPGFAFAACDQIGDCLEAALALDATRIFGDVPSQDDRHEILDRVVGQLLVQHAFSRHRR